MARLRRVSARQPGFARVKRGTGFSYVDADGDVLPKDEVERIKSLAIPPAWTDVWVCPYPNGHLQAVGTDDAGRRQYLYHPDWRKRRDRSKFERVTQAAEMLPTARRRITKDLRLDGMPLERAAATAVRLLDVGYFRIGNDAYTDAHGSFGLTTLERQHVRSRRGELVFSFVGKSGISHTIAVDDKDAIASLDVMRKRRADGDRLLAYRDGSTWRDLSSADVNAYLSDLFGGNLTAKDFRTWHATVIAAEVLATTDEPGDSGASRKRAIKQATTEVAAYLGNTPTIARNSYIDPRILDAYESGSTIGEAATKRYSSAQARQTGLEAGVLSLLG
ncbi:MAG TPA: DNA topoisomerase IB [Tessaracoccus flavescens]|uniref:DNA topoisomerase n=1 Tax=Tessaracoccus flavescens TaxID=399497 RepID=A0A921JQZ8_9ACTN|nr:DNA topoisomerase IB [Tessaracoccus flavescens]